MAMKRSEVDNVSGRRPNETEQEIELEDGSDNAQASLITGDRPGDGTCRYTAASDKEPESTDKIKLYSYSAGAYESRIEDRPDDHVYSDVDAPAPTDPANVNTGASEAVFSVRTIVVASVCVLILSTMVSTIAAVIVYHTLISKMHEHGTLLQGTQTDSGREKCPDVENVEDHSFILNGTCYHMVEKAMTEVTYDYARSDCKSRNGHLFTIPDSVRQEAMLPLLGNAGDSHTILLGAQKVNGKWVWDTGAALTYDNFDTSSTAVTGDCAVLTLADFGSGAGVWEQKACTANDWFTAYVCEHTTARPNSASTSSITSFVHTLLIVASSIFLANLW